MDSRILNWYMNYCCRDDYGATTNNTSAWAGIQYFASREPEEKGPLTWPEGNGWIVRRLLERVGSFVETNRMVHKISRRGKGFSVLAGDTEYQTEFIIFAAPTFLASYLVEGMAPLHDFEYSPWLTANLTLEHYPDSYGTDPTWDSVFMESPTLGYVDATHQICPLSRGTYSLDFLLGFGRWTAIGKSAIAVEHGLEILEGSDFSRP